MYRKRYNEHNYEFLVPVIDRNLLHLQLFFILKING